MLSKILLAATLVALPAAANTAAQNIRTGEWIDGAKIAWQCSDKTQGTIQFYFVTPEGKPYQGLMVCGETI